MRIHLRSKLSQVLAFSLFALHFGATAQVEERIAHGSPHSASLLLGFGAGGTAFGFGYEYMYDQAAGLGGHLRIFPKDDSLPTTNTGFTIAGAAMVHHFYKRAWDLSFSPSVNVINIDPVSTNADSETTLGPGLTISLMTQLTDMISLGFDNSRYWIWFNDEYGGMSLDDFAVRIRLNF